MAQQQCVLSANWKKVCNLEGPETQGQRSCRSNVVKV